MCEGLKTLTRSILHGINVLTVLMKSELMSSLSFTVTHVREQIEAKIEQEVKGKVTSDF